MQEVFGAFRDEVLSDKNKQKLFVMVVDEAHHAATRHGAHDAFVNDLMWKASGEGKPRHGAWPSGLSADHEVAGELCQAPNLVTLLVSATPACLLTGNSRLPRAYYLPQSYCIEDLEMELGQFSIIKSVGHDPDRPTRLENMVWKCENKEVPVAYLQHMIKCNVSLAVAAVFAAVFAVVSAVIIRLKVHTFLLFTSMATFKALSICFSDLLPLQTRLI